MLCTQIQIRAQNANATYFSALLIFLVGSLKHQVQASYKPSQSLFPQSYTVSQSTIMRKKQHRLASTLAHQRSNADLCAKSEHLDFFLLTNPMSTVLSLQINLWVPTIRTPSINNPDKTRKKGADAAKRGSKNLTSHCHKE